MQSNPQREKMGPAQFWFRNFCPCCYKRNDTRKRSTRPHRQQKQVSKLVTLRTHREGR